MKWFSPILIVGLGILLLFAGSAAASVEQSVASAIGRFITNKWVAFGLILIGVLLFANEEGYLKA